MEGRGGDGGVVAWRGQLRSSKREEEEDIWEVVWRWEGAASLKRLLMQRWVWGSVPRAGRAVVIWRSEILGASGVSVGVLCEFWDTEIEIENALLVSRDLERGADGGDAT